MAFRRPETPPRRRRPILAVLMLLIVTLSLGLVLREAHLAGEARRNIPPACLVHLSRLPVDLAQAEGVPLRDCSRRRQPSESRAKLLGSWSYGPAAARINGHIALLREEGIDGLSRDRIMHVRVEDSHLRLNELTLEGLGCAGGVADAYVKGENFGMTVNLTPEALLRFRQDARFEATYVPGDLATDATACAARLTLIDRRPVMIQLNAKTLSEGTGKPAVAPEVSSRQGCFERLLARYTAEGRQTLMFPDGHEEFTADYVAACAPNPPPAAKPAGNTRRQKRGR